MTNSTNGLVQKCLLSANALTLTMSYAIYHCSPTHQAAETNFKEIWGSDSDFARWLCDVRVEKSKTNTMSLVLWFIEKYLYHIL